MQLTKNKTAFESMEIVFKQAFNDQLMKGNQKAIDEGIKLMKEINITRIPTATTQERINYTVYKIMEYVDKWTA